MTDNTAVFLIRGISHSFARPRCVQIVSDCRPLRLRTSSIIVAFVVVSIHQLFYFTLSESELTISISINVSA